MDDRRQLALGMAERGEQPLDAVERQVDDLGMKREQPLEDGVARAWARRSPVPRRCGCADAVIGGSFACRQRPSRRRRRLAALRSIRRRRTRDSVARSSLAVHDHVDHAVLEQILGALEAFRQLFADGLLDHARRRRSRSGAGLGDLRCRRAWRRTRRRRRSSGSVSTHDVGQARLVQHRRRRWWCAASASARGCLPACARRRRRRSG